MLLGSAACGGDSKSGSNPLLPATSSNTAAVVKNGSDKTDACALMTQADASTLIGEQADAGKSGTGVTSNIGQSICTYANASGTSIKIAQLSVVRTQDMDPAMRSRGYSAKKLFDDSKTLYQDRQPVSGVGDDAFSRPGQFHVLKGNVSLSITVTGQGSDNALPSMMDEAKKVLSRTQ